MEIFKFGGASVKDAASIKNLTSIIKRRTKKPLLIVISAMGKSTSQLEQIAQLSFRNESHAEKLEILIDYHKQIATDLGLDSENILSDLVSNLRKKLSNPGTDSRKFLDSILIFGELMSTRIIHAYCLNHFDAEWVDARNLIKTDSMFGEARVNWEKTSELINQTVKPILENKKIIITQGYIGSDNDGNDTTLGKEGSDFSAAIFANCLDAESMTVWKDVQGILTADPKLMEDVTHIDQLSYEEITEMTYYGAKVIHPKTIVPLAQKNIPLFVKSFITPDHPGTSILPEDHSKITIPVFIYKFNQMLVSFRVRDNSFMDEGKLMRIFSVLDQLAVKINLMQNSALTFSICFDESESKFREIQNRLGEDYIITFNQSLHLATVKNYDTSSLCQLIPQQEKIVEQKSRSVYQVLYVPK